MDPVVHFEMPYDEPKRMAAFYQSAFGWQTLQLGEEEGSYVLASTAPCAPDGRPTQPGTINGGFFRREPGGPAQHPSVVVAVDDIHAAIERVTKAGGQVLGEPMEIQGVGKYVSFRDTEGNRVAMLEPAPRT